MSSDINLEDVMRFTEGLIIQEQLVLSGAHLQSAAFFTRRAAHIEVTYSTPPLPDLIRIEHYSYVTGALFSAVAAAEAAIREFFINVFTIQEEVQRWGLNATVQQNLRDWWIAGGEKKPTKERYKEALRIAGKTPLPTGEGSLSESMAFLTHLRNLLTHYTPVWRIAVVDNPHPAALAAIQQRDQLNEDLQKQQKLERHLQGKFRPNTLTTSRSFPLTHLSHGCATWAVETSSAYIDTFCTTMGTPSPVVAVRADLQTT